MSAVLRVGEAGSRFGPWLFGARMDLMVFTGSALLALVVAGVARIGGVSGVSDATWLVLVLGIDVAHVHATWFRTYLDPSELKRHPVRYSLLPALAYICGFCAYQLGPGVFWRGLAYLAVFHFVRQQVGWVALYRARAQLNGRLERAVDDAAVYAATTYPLLVWHAHLREKQFSWLSPGDFVALDLERYLPTLTVLWATALALFFTRELRRMWLGERVVVGRVLLVLGTALTWYFGIVVNESDFVFTATNVIPHGVPYIWFLFVYSRERGKQEPVPMALRFAVQGLAIFMAVLLAFAFIEEWAWDRLVDHDRAWLFGEGSWFGAGAQAAPAWLAFLVPLLALPQATHYLLDGLLWRRRARAEKGAVERALGFERQVARCSSGSRVVQVGGVHS